jgi:hypothetical protein
MKRNDRISLVIGCLFFVLFLYFLNIEEYLATLGWLLLTVTMFLGAYTPKKFDRREILILVNVILPFIAIGIFIYRIIYM